VSEAGFRVAPVVLTAPELGQRTRALGQPVYGAGSEPGRGYELSRDDRRIVTLRYVPETAYPGGPEEEQAVTTIPFAGAYARTEQLAQDPSAVSKRFLDGSIAWYRRDRPTVVYLAFPTLDYVIQVTSATPGRARDLVFGGRIREVV